MNVFGLGGNLDEFQEEQDKLKLELLDTLDAVSPSGWTTFEELEQRMTQKIATDEQDVISLGGVLPSVLAGATHEGLVLMESRGTRSHWKLSDKGAKRLKKLKR